MFKIKEGKNGMKKLKRIVSILLIVASVLNFNYVTKADDALGSCSVWNGEIASGFARGSGSKDDPFVIETAGQLAYFAKQCNDGNSYKNAYIVLNNNIDLNNVPWTPIAESKSNFGYGTNYSYSGIENLFNNDFKNSVFSGYFDGNGFSIYNLSFSNESAVNHWGFFGVSNGYICNVNIHGMHRLSHENQSDTALFGGVVSLQQDGFIKNCSVTIDLEENIQDRYFANSINGGIVGIARGTSIENCSVSGTSGISLKSKPSGSARDRCIIMGGVCGLADDVQVLNCENKMSVTGNNLYLIQVGGIIGVIGPNEDEQNCTKIISCSNYGNISTDADYGNTAGILGYENHVYGEIIIKNCNNYGKLEAYGHVGGILGEGCSGYFSNTGHTSKSYIDFCANYGDVVSYFDRSNNGLTMVGGIVGNLNFADYTFIRCSFNYGNVMIILGLAGGIAGRANKYTYVSDCFNRGSVKSIKGYNYYSSGGIIGGWHPAYKYKDHIPNVSNCYNIGEVSDPKGCGAISGSTYGEGKNNYYLDNMANGNYDNSKSDIVCTKLSSSEMKLASCYRGFDFENTWAIDEKKNGGYPYIKAIDVKPIVDTSAVKFSSDNELAYPIYDKGAFTNQLESWINNSDLKDAFDIYMQNGMNYSDFLEMTIDLPVMSDDGKGYLVEGKTKVKDLMAYIIFANSTKKYMNDVEAEMMSKLESGDSKKAFQLFYDKLINFNLQYNYFQKDLNGDSNDNFNQTLTNLILAKTAMEIVNEMKVTNKEGKEYYIAYNPLKENEALSEAEMVLGDDIESVVKFKSFNYINDFYRANTSESYKNYDDLYYYIMSGGDTTYLNESFEKILDEYSRIIKNGKKIYKIITSDENNLSSTLELTMDNVLHYTVLDEKNKSRLNTDLKWTYDQYKDYKGYFDNAKDVYKVMQGIVTMSPVGALSSTWTLTNEYLDKVKSFYDKAEKTEFGWYAFSYYYLSENNMNLLNSIIDQETGSSEYNINNKVLYGESFDTNDIFEANIMKYYDNNQAYYKHAYTPDQETRFFMINSCNTLNRLNSVDLSNYSHMLLEYILAELGRENSVFNAELLCSVQSNNDSLGSVSFENADNKYIVTAVPKENSNFVGWLDVDSNQIVSTNTKYESEILGSTNITAIFTNAEDTINNPRIVNITGNQSIGKGESFNPLTISVEGYSDTDVEIKWYMNNTSCNSNGVYISSGSQIIPNSDSIGTIYYYAEITKKLSGGEEVVLARSNSVKMVVGKPIVKGIDICLEEKEYKAGYELTKEDMHVFINYSDNSKIEINDYTIENAILSNGLNTVNISFLDLNKIIELTVEEAEVNPTPEPGETAKPSETQEPSKTATPTPSVEPSEMVTPTPSLGVSTKPNVESSASPTTEPSISSGPEPSETVTPTPSSKPSASPSPSAAPSASETPSPSASAKPVISSVPSTIPGASTKPKPSASPSSSAAPSASETPSPSASAKPVISSAPSTTPGVSTKPKPSASPSSSPSEQPSEIPSISPSEFPNEDIVKGDVNGDNQVTLTDAQIVLKVALGITSLTDESVADVNGDKQVTLIDVQLVLKAALGIIKL